MTNFGQGMMVVLSSPSGVGKTTIANLLSQRSKNFEISISHTTRSPRINELDGKDYYFVNKDKFKALIKNNSFFEHAEVFGNLYGTTKEAVVKKLNKGVNILFDIDWQGTKQLEKQKLDYKIVTFFILPPSKKVLKERLSNRDMKDKLIVHERMSQFKADVIHWKEYDYVVINNDLEKCYDEIKKIIISEIEGKKINLNYKKIEEKIKSLIN